ncbi:MAG: hypothetical protein HY784_08010 [Chloroflexi bacterium]|nr:hypothetical protein [Chloroflexota bacterium]
MKLSHRLSQPEALDGGGVFRADADQSRVDVRTAAPGILVGATGLAYSLGRRLLPPAPDLTGLCLLGPVSLTAGLVAAWVGETLLKRYWPSGPFRSRIP